MAIQKIHRFHALKPGSEIWFLPSSQFSSWTPTIDWYLNFQIRKFDQRKQSQIPSEIKQIMMDEEIRFEFSLDHSKNLLIASPDYIPAKAVVIIPNDNPQEMAQAIQSYTDMMNVKSIRVFLPQKMIASDFIKNWNSKSKVKVSLVEDFLN